MESAASAATKAIWWTARTGCSAASAEFKNANTSSEVDGVDGDVCVHTAYTTHVQKVAADFVCFGSWILGAPQTSKL